MEFTELLQSMQYGYMQRALLGAVLAGIACPLVGMFLVLRRLALIADGLAHISFAGVAAALLVRTQPLATAAVVVLLGALGIERLRAGQRTSGDTAIAITSTLGLAAGIILAGRAGGGSVDLLGFLFGSLVTVQPADLALIAALAIIVVIFIALLYKDLLAISIDETVARAAGIPIRLVNHLLIILTALTIVVAMRIVGTLLVTALMVLPVAASLQVARGMAQALVASVGFGIISAVTGLAFAYIADIPAGGAIALAGAAMLALASMWSKEEDSR